MFGRSLVPLRVVPQCGGTGRRKLARVAASEQFPGRARRVPQLWYRQRHPELQPRVYLAQRRHHPARRRRRFDLVRLSASDGLPAGHPGRWHGQAHGRCPPQDTGANRLGGLRPRYGQRRGPVVLAIGDHRRRSAHGLPSRPARCGHQPPGKPRPLGGDFVSQEKILHGFTGPPVFYLAGGAKGYAQFLRQQLAQQNRRTLTATSGSGPKFVGAARPAGGGGSCCGGRK